MESGAGNSNKNDGPARAKPRRAKPSAGAAKGRKPKRAEQVRRPDNGPVEGKRSDRIIAFCERLIVPSGIGQGTPLVLREWQKELIRGTYDPVDENGRRKVRRALWSMARKNAKTGLAAALVLVHLCGPEAKVNGEVYSAASDRDQAAQIYKMASQMVLADPDLSQICKPIDTQKRIVCYHLGSFYRALAADARRLHGFNPVFVVYDELAQAKNRELFDVLTTSFGAQPEGLFLAISTQSSDPEHIMTELSDEALEAEKQPENERDPTFYGKVYYTPLGVDIFEEKNWYLGNPALDDFKSLEHMRALASKAKRSPAAKAAFMALELNMRVDSVEGLVAAEDWKACRGDVNPEKLKGKPLYISLDLSKKMDLTSANFAWDCGETVETKSYFWTPEHELAQRAKQDGARYVEWWKKGHMDVLPGKLVAYAPVLQKVAKLAQGHDVIAVSFDAWNIETLQREMELAGIAADAWPMHSFGQGFKDMSPAVEKLETMAIAHSVIHDNNPVMNYCLFNVRIISDPAGNRKFDKRKKNRRIDGAVTLAMNLSAIDKAEKVEKPKPSIYETRGLIRV